MQTLKLNSRGADVITLQHHLNLAEDGIFGKITEETVKAFQRARGLTPDGIVGPKTWQLILQLPSATYAKYEAAPPFQASSVSKMRCCRSAMASKTRLTASSW